MYDPINRRSMPAQSVEEELAELAALVAVSLYTSPSPRDS